MNANSLATTFGIPGRVVTGQPTELINQPMTTENQLRNIGARRPDVIQGMFKHFAEHTGMISELLQHLSGSSYDPTAEKVKSERGMKADFESFKKKFKIMNNMEFAWKSPSPEGYVYTVLEAPVFDGDDTVGRNLAEFSFVLNRKLADHEDVFGLADGTTQIVLTRPPEELTRGIRVWARLLVNKGADAAKRAIPMDLLSFGAELERKYNIKGEASQHGSKSRITFGEWHRGFMTCMRWEWNITGHAAHIKNQDNTPMKLIYTTHDGKVEMYWTEKWRYQTMKEAYMQMDEQLFWGLPWLDKNGNFAKDARGYRYYSGTGIYHQANRRLKREYTRLDSFDIIDDLMEGLYYDAIENDGEVCLLCMGGVQWRKAFDKLMRNEFSARPEVLFWDGYGNFHTASEGKAKGVMGIRSNFTYYETSVGKFIVSKMSYFDRKARATRYTQKGKREQSYRAIIMNLGNIMGGNHPMTMVTLQGRQNVLGRIAGMSNPGPGNLLTTPVDIEGEHMLTMQGVALHNPNCLAELKPARGLL